MGTVGVAMRQDLPVEPEALRMLELLSEGYTVTEAAQIAYPNHGDSLKAWHSARRRNLDRLAALNDVQGYRHAAERGLIRVKR